MIEHTVAFNLKHEPGSPEEQAFLEGLRIFADIPGVQDYRVNRQVSSKGPFGFQISMWFDTQEQLEAYDAHQVHVDFVQKRWIPECADWQTLDFVQL